MICVGYHSVKTTVFWLAHGILVPNLFAQIPTFNPFKVRKRTQIRNRYNQVTHLTQDTNGKVKN